MVKSQVVTPLITLGLPHKTAAAINLIVAGMLPLLVILGMQSYPAEAQGLRHK